MYSNCKESWIEAKISYYSRLYSKSHAVDFKPVLAPTDPQIAYFSRETLLPWITVFGVQFYHRVYFGPEYWYPLPGSPQRLSPKRDF